MCLPFFNSSFSTDDIYVANKSPPIQQDTVVELNSVTGQVLRKWGSNMFYMPHGLTIDSTGCFWLTDVALHQVFKFTPSNTKNASMILGERFTPGHDSRHFCKPTSVAVHSKSGDIYVADGYCNARVAKFNSKGEYLSEYVSKEPTSSYPSYGFNIPHKIILIEEVNSACVADRENGRMICYDIINGNAEQPLVINDFSGLLYSISYAHCYAGSLIFAVNGRPRREHMQPSIFVISLKNRSLVTKFGPEYWPPSIYVSFYFQLSNLQ